jgi:multicomponent Na+:H+ antiporter subunit E
MSMALRFAGLLGLWLVLAGADPLDLPFGLVAAGAATWTSLRLLPPSAVRLRPFAALRLAAELLREVAAGGVDVAWRALHPRRPITPGLLRHGMTLPAGVAQDGFRALASLQPGSLPAGTDTDGALVVHCLDTSQPVAAGLTRAEALFAATLRHDPRHG